MSKPYAILPWDSEFFGLSVARLVPGTLTKEKLALLVREMRAEGIDLAYWAANGQDPAAVEAGESLGGFLADRKVTYGADLLELPASPSLDSSSIELFSGSAPEPGLEDLAILSSRHSRFRVDPRIPPGKCDELYRLWIRRSISRQLADAVLVRRDTAGRIIGFVTLAVEDGTGSIGLIAVDPGSSGRGHGRALMEAAHAFYRAEGLSRARVVTQADNTAACRLYEKCGYRVDRCESFFHFWLR